MQVFGEALAELQEVASAGAEAVEKRPEVVDRASGAAGAEAVPVVLVELAARGVIVVQSVSLEAAYATEVKRRRKPQITPLKTSYPEGRGQLGMPPAAKTGEP